jgi:hypothetical protein
MKRTHITTTVAALAFAALFGTSAHADSSDDLVVSFQVAGGSDKDNNYEVDLGSISQFLNPTQTTQNFTLSQTDLNSYFGSTWATDVTAPAAPPNPATFAVQWGLIGANTGTSTLSYTNTNGTSKVPKGTLFLSSNTFATAPTERTFGQEATTLSDIGFLYGDTNGGPAATGSPAGPSIITSTGNDSDGFANEVNNSNFNLGGSVGLLDNTPDDTFLAADTATLDLYEVTPTVTSPVTLEKPTTLLGSFVLSAAGVLTFTVAPAPEPSTYLMMGIGGLVVVWRLRRSASV